MSIFKRFSALVLSLVMILSCGSMAFAAEDNTVSLKDIFEEAKAEYQIAPLSDAEETKEMVYEEIELEDGSKLIVEGYPTAHMVEGTVLEEGEEAESYVYRQVIRPAESISFVFDEDDDFDVGYLQSTLKFERKKITIGGQESDGIKLTSFSYNISLFSGNNMSKITVEYYSHQGNTQETVEKSISATQLVMTNFPTTSLGWVRANGATGFDETGVRYYPVINRKTYFVPHPLNAGGTGL